MEALQGRAKPAESGVMHQTLNFERLIAGAPARVFHAYEDLSARQQWAVSDGDRIEYDEADFSIGGSDRFRCGPAGDLSIEGSVRYEVIVPATRIVWVETISQAGTALSSALVSLEFFARNGGTLVLVAAQVAAFDGGQMIGGYRRGWKASLTKLASFF